MFLERTWIKHKQYSTAQTVLPQLAHASSDAGSSCTSSVSACVWFVSAESLGSKLELSEATAVSIQTHRLHHCLCPSQLLPHSPEEPAPSVTTHYACFLVLLPRETDLSTWARIQVSQQKTLTLQTVIYSFLSPVFISGCRLKVKGLTCGNSEVTDKVHPMVDSSHNRIWGSYTWPVLCRLRISRAEQERLGAYLSPRKTKK